MARDISFTAGVRCRASTANDAMESAFATARDSDGLCLH
jgi:hypothetical protein